MIYGNIYFDMGGNPDKKYGTISNVLISDLDNNNLWIFQSTNLSLTNYKHSQTGSSLSRPIAKSKAKDKAMYAVNWNTTSFTFWEISFGSLITKLSWA